MVPPQPDVYKSCVIDIYVINFFMISGSPLVTGLHLVPHLPRLVGWGRRTSSSHTDTTSIYIYKPPVETVYLQTCRFVNFSHVNEEWSIFPEWRHNLSLPLVMWKYENFIWIILSYHIIQLSIILRKSKIIPPPAKHLYHIANEIPVSNDKLLQLNRFWQLS